MLNCPNCTAKVLPDQAVCKACGEPLPDVEGATGDQPDPMLGRTVAASYEIEELLGVGAMGRVYGAKQLSLDKQVAIKVLHRHLGGDPKIAKRFHREARAASRLSHPNSLQILDFGEDDDGTLYIAMELLDGDDLLTIIEEDSPLPPARISNIFGQVLTALDEAHHAGIIHRDLKPENVVVLEGRAGAEHVKVCDFGIAKIVEQEGGSAITVSGFVCGTPEYMAPEQARGDDIDARADIYAAGCMLYQMLTGTVPFKADSALGIITQHLTQEPVPPRTRRPDLNIPRGLEEIALVAMEKDRERRFPDAATMKQELEAVVEALGPMAKEPLGASDLDPTERIVIRKPDVARPPVQSSTEQELAALPIRSGRGGVLALVLLGAAAVVTAIALGGRDPGASIPDAGVAAPPPLAVDAAGADEPDAGEPDAGEPDAGEPDAGAEDAGRGRGPRTPRPPREDPDRPSMEPDPPEAPDGRSRGQVLFDEGRELFRASDVAGAIRKFEQAAQLMPGNAAVHKQLGRAYMRAGDVPRAIAAYRRYLELAPGASDREIIEAIIQRGGG